MGQKVSTTEDSRNVEPTESDSLQLATKSKQAFSSSEVKSTPNSLTTRKSSFADAERLESGDAPSLPRNEETDTDNAVDTAIREQFDDEGRNVDEDNSRSESSSKIDSNAPSEAFTAIDILNPTTAELNQLTALRMMQNYQDFHAKIDDLLENHVKETNEKVLDDNLSEKDFRTISYESLPTMQLVESVVTLKCDSSTYTHESKEYALNELGNVGFNEENLSCKEENLAIEEVNECPEAEVWSDNDEEEATTIKDEDDDDSDGDELLRLRERLDRLEQERDEAKTRLRIVEDRCQAYEDESRCLDVCLGSLEEKLRCIMMELGNEVQRSQDFSNYLSTVVLHNNSEEQTNVCQGIGGE